MPRGEYKKFRDLLRGGIGSRTQKAFSDETGVTPEHLSRMLNQPVISRPSLTTLRKLAKKLDTVTLSELKEACGYEIPPVDPLVPEVETAVADYFTRAAGKASYPTIGHAMAAVKLPKVKGVTYRRVIPVDTKEVVDGDTYTVPFHTCWMTDDWDCTTCVQVVFRKTGPELYLLESFQLAPPPLSQEDIEAGYDVNGAATVVRRRRFNLQAEAIISQGVSAEERLISAIFGVRKYPSVISGFGFYYTETPETFSDYLFAHAGSFCVDQERSALFRELAEGNKGPDEVFAEFWGGSESAGTGSVVAEILSRETGYSFRYYAQESETEEEFGKDACIMATDAPSRLKDVPNRLCVAVYSSALGLGIAEFGKCYHMETVEAEPVPMYKTKDYHLEYDGRENKGEKDR